MDQGAHIDLDVTDVAHGGVFVGRHEGRVVFVPDAIPGERVRVRVTEAGDRSFWRGEVLDVIDASSHRRAHVWREADVARPPQDRPGGADFGHIDLAHQRILKAKVVNDAMRRMAGIDAEVSLEPAGAAGLDDRADGLHWRTRVGLHVDGDGTVGPFASRSRRVVPVSAHPLAAEEIEEAIARLAPQRPGRVDLVLPAEGGVRVLPRPEAPGRDRRRRRGSDPRPVRTAADEQILTESVRGRTFQVDAGGFWQVHRLAAVTLHDAVRSALAEIAPDGLDPDAEHLDLYGGVGLLAAAVAEAGGSRVRVRVTSVEADERATAHALANLDEWPGAQAATARVDGYLRGLEDADPRRLAALGRGVVVLDPPRAGAGRDVVESIARLHPAAAVYVACDPVALARDVASFAGVGYRMRSLRAFDLFPHSHHIEAVAILTPADREA